MNIPLMQERTYSIAESEKSPEYLAMVSNFFWNTVDYLKGGTSLPNYQLIFEEACGSFGKEEAHFRVAPIWDSLLTALFYYKRAVTCAWLQREKNRVAFHLMLLDIYDSLTRLFMEETGEEVEHALSGERLLEELRLSGGPTFFSQKEIWKETLWMYDKSVENKLLTGSSNLGVTLRQNRRMLFFSRFPFMSFSEQLSDLLSGTTAIFLVLFLFRFFYNKMVELPLYQRIAMDRSVVLYKHRDMELWAQFHSFIDYGFPLFWREIILCLVPSLVVFGIEYMAGWYGNCVLSRCPHKI